MTQTTTRPAFPALPALPNPSPLAVARLRALATERGWPAQCLTPACARARRCRGRFRLDGHGSGLLLPICLLAERLALVDDLYSAEERHVAFDSALAAALGLPDPFELDEADLGSVEAPAPRARQASAGRSSARRDAR